MPYLDFNLSHTVTLEDVVAGALGVLLIVVLAVVARWLLNRAIDRVVRRASKGAVPGVLRHGKAGGFLNELRPGANARRMQRAEAMGSLLKSIVTGVIGGLAVLMVLDRVGLPIGPLLTGAGILGVAVGFGAQTLVKDFLSGVFMILEDQYGVGDVIDLGEASGTVEAVGLRVTRLRDVSGTVWYVRNGEVLRVGNLSQNWARSVLDITVGYESDLDHVQEILKQVAHEVYEDPAFAGDILEEPEVPGIERFDKDGPVLRVLVKTAPLKQWDVSRALRERIKIRFDAAGIRIPATITAPMATEGQQ
jgi:small conductance mechanosensitive channel